MFLKQLCTFYSLLSCISLKVVVFTKFIVQEDAAKEFKPKQSCLPSKTPQMYSRLLRRNNSTMIQMLCNDKIREESR
ncbi:uncharacterized protein Gasu_62780 [Galdieria sulphuraria]|uniref:Secreted protein n=1 Tax=Galdieria sulphuraria TaxID=130081 RepID=M2X897_GALSU|nr:uncharacterized protein Gasu_62780 [Galdieria sulphuraria]EME26072.1 hypothetical protein Gasu_62780 [Galdieria sulphuraria]|eukprot:XP_005702592.1 hypothetical protein Gasu_62780 [Galdieria sulphuraria]